MSFADAALPDTNTANASGGGSDDAPTLGKRLKATKTEDYRAERRTLPGYGDTRVMQEIAKTDDFHLTSDALKAKTT